MGSVYAKGSKLYLSFKDPATGNSINKASTLPVGQEKQAHALLKNIEAQLSAGAEYGALDGRITVRGFGDRWIERRKARGLASAVDDESCLIQHVYPLLGTKELGAVAIQDVRRRQCVFYGPSTATSTNEKIPASRMACGASIGCGDRI